ncbi:MAG: response regulator [Dehalococcoidia bacterium]|jgi:excisionase family DNA binding protein
MTEFMTVEEVARLLRVTKKTVYRLLERGDIPAVKVGHSWRFDKVEIDRWVKWLSEKSDRNKAAILIIDDDETICSLFKDTLEEAGHKVTTTSEPSRGLELVKEQDYDLVFLDLKMPEMDGAELFGQIRLINSELPVTIITGYPDSDSMTRALAHGPFGIVNKPFNSSNILRAVDSYVRFGNHNK